MRKGKPIIAISQEGITFIGFMKCLVHFVEPLAYAAVYGKEPGEKIQFCFNRNCCNAANGKDDHKEDQPSPDIFFCLFHILKVLCISKCKYKKNYFTPFI